MALSVIAGIYTTVAPVYHWRLSGCQNDEVDRMQRREMKIIYGNKTSYRAALELSKVLTLKDHREDIVKKFVTKTAANPNFKHWFPEHPPYDHNIRKRKSYKEEKANTERLFRSPLFSMRRLLIELN